MKKYIANSTISVSVSLPNGGNARVSFSPLSDGSSVFYTNDKEIQFALEHHYKFGKLFNLVGESQEENATAANKPTQCPAKKGKKGSKKETTKNDAIMNEQPTMDEEAESPANEESGGEEERDEEAEPREVSVSDLDAAKDYLAENYDVVRTKLKTEEIINETAHSFGITFKYL